MWPNPQETADLVTFTKEILNGKLYFLCSGRSDRDLSEASHAGWEVLARDCNQFHNILRLSDVLPNVPFTTSETMCSTYKHGKYELPHELPNDLRNIRKLSKLHTMIAQRPVHHNDSPAPSTAMHITPTMPFKTDGNSEFKF